MFNESFKIKIGRRVPDKRMVIIVNNIYRCTSERFRFTMFKLDLYYYWNVLQNYTLEIAGSTLFTTLNSSGIINRLLTVAYMT